MSPSQFNQNIVEQHDLPKLKEELNKKKQSIVFTNGCFDILHLGHIDYLKKAKALGDILVVGVNSDKSVKTLNKGEARPIKDEVQRTVILASLKFVDFVVCFDDQTPIELIKTLEPNVLVKGGDYSKSQTDPTQKNYIVGSREVVLLGNKISVIPFLKGYSTSLIEQKIISLNQ